MDVELRLLKKLVADPKTGCWEWCGYLNKTLYGQIGWNGKIWLTHRVAYSIWVKAIPNGLLVCHKCDNPRCCNPDHLFVGTVKDNVRDRQEKGRSRRPRYVISIVKLERRPLKELPMELPVYRPWCPTCCARHLDNEPHRFAISTLNINSLDDLNEEERKDQEEDKDGRYR